MKKFISLLCAAAATVCTSASALPVAVWGAADMALSITVASVQAEPGESVQVPVTIAGNTGICGAEVEVQYDNALTLAAAANGTAFSGMNYTAPGDLTADPVTLLWDNTDVVNANGEIAVLTFTAPDKEGIYNVTAAVEDGNIVDGDLNPVDVTVINGSVTVKSTASDACKITEQPSDYTVGVKHNAIFSVTAENAASYRWQYSKNGTTWYNSSSTGAKTDTLTVTVKNTNYKYLYRCKVTGKDNTVIYSDTATVDLIPGAKITEQPSSVCVTSGEKAVFTVAADNATAYQWYYSKDGGTNWYKSGITGAATDTLTVTVTNANKNNLYKCKITGTDENIVTSSSVGLVIIAAQPTNSTAAIGSTGTFTVKADSDNPIDTYKWYYSKDSGKTWYVSSSTGSDTDTLSVKATTANRTNLYRCKVTSSAGLFGWTKAVGFSDAAVKITDQPVSKTTAVGQKATFTVTAENVASYQWYYSKDGNTWYKSSASGNATASLTVSVTSSNAANQYRCKVTGTDGTSVYTVSVSAK